MLSYSSNSVSGNANLRLASHRIRHKGVALQSLLNRRNQVDGQAALGNVAGGAGGERRGNKVPVFMNGQEYDLHSRIGFLDRSRQLKAIEDRHRDIGHKNIRIQRKNGRHSLLTIIRGLQNLIVITKHPSDYRDHLPMIIGQHHSNLIHGDPFGGQHASH